KVQTDTHAVARALREPGRRSLLGAWREFPEFLPPLASLNLCRVSPLPALSPPCGERVAGRPGEGWFMGRGHLQNLDVNRSHEPWRSGVSAERRNSWEQQPAALCRDAATGRRFIERGHVQSTAVS